ncbi:MAG: class I SAM-dependent methyltransferase [Candidatus Omnitrophota bacterium]|jgi:SAM-dependent methyltransferase
MITTTSNLFSEIKDYIKLGRELQTHLEKYPDDWPKFQKTFNQTLDNLYGDILLFEKTNIAKSESKVYKLKKIFEKRYRRYFLHGEFIKWSYEKPYGYAGDFKIIEDIYQNNPSTTGFDRLWDNYFQQLATPFSIRERKEDFKKIIFDFMNKNRNKDIHIMNLASGPAREIKESLEFDSNKLFSKVTFDCCDFDATAIDYAKQLLGNVKNVNFFQKNAIRLALKKDIKEEIPCDYDLIYSTGLFDYLDARVATRLIGNLKKLLKKDGMLVISSAAEKYNNPSAGWMEWVAEWYLIYRTVAEFKKIFLDAGFSSKNLEIVLQKSKVMQYCFAHII